MRRSRSIATCSAPRESSRAFSGSPAPRIRGGELETARLCRGCAAGRESRGESVEAVAHRPAGGASRPDRSTCCGNEDLLQQVVTNLLLNAANAMDDRGGKVVPGDRGDRADSSYSPSPITAAGSPRTICEMFSTRSSRPCRSAKGRDLASPSVTRSSSSTKERSTSQAPRDREPRSPSASPRSCDS